MIFVTTGLGGGTGTARRLSLPAWPSELAR
jgi:hypothetical protein